jgi:crotonobetainyl-CoA:carnitine CoA-transferase CaiB-like acyl-CoA transferase
LIRISAFGTDGPAAHLTGYDLNAQAASGLLMADARIGDEVPIRAGGVAMTDFTAGLLATVAGLAGLTRARATGHGGETEVSLLGAGLALQVQRFISTAHPEPTSRLERAAGERELDATAEAMALGLRTNAYYRAYRTADGFIAVGCLNLAQRNNLLRRFGLEDASVEDPDELPENEHEERRREQVVEAIAAGLAEGCASDWVTELRSLGIPCEEVRALDDLFWDRQVIANGLIQVIDQPGLGPLSLLGNLFKVDGQALPAQRPAPMPGQDNADLLQTLRARRTAPLAAERST